MSALQLITGDCTEVLKSIPDASVDAIITDPPYPEISRPYGKMTEVQWHAMMRSVVGESRRILKPRGSAVFILQPNSERVGRMRAWLWEFMAWVAKEWNLIQDVWWWNYVVAPTIHVRRNVGLLRPSIKACVWLGSENCFRNQDAVLWSQSQSNAAQNRSDRALRRLPSGQSMRNGRCAAVADERGGVTPFNCIPMSNANSTNSAGAHGHGAGTPLDLCRWWVRYICPENGTVCDPFMGSGTMGIAALERGSAFVGIEKMPKYVEMAKDRLEALVKKELSLF